MIRVPTDKPSFHQRRYLLETWGKSLREQARPGPFSAADLVSVRIHFFRDEAEVSRKVDQLYARALVHLANTHVQTPR